MKNKVGASHGNAEQAMPAAVASLAASSATIVLASVTHAYEFGYRAFAAGFAIIVLLYGISKLYQRTGHKVLLVFYGLLNAWVVIGFGLVNGFWNHAFKVFLHYLHNGSLPPFLAKLFMTPQIGSFVYEGTGVLTFAMSVAASYYGYKLIKEGK